MGKMVEKGSPMGPRFRIVGRVARGTTPKVSYNNDSKESLDPSRNWLKRSKESVGEVIVGERKLAAVGLGTKVPSMKLFLLWKNGLRSCKKLKEFGSAEGEKKLGEIGGRADGTGDKIPGKFPDRSKESGISNRSTTSMSPVPILSPSATWVFSIAANRAAGDSSPLRLDDAAAADQDSDSDSAVEEEEKPVRRWTSLLGLMRLLRSERRLFYLVRVFSNLERRRTRALQLSSRRRWRRRVRHAGGIVRRVHRRAYRLEHSEVAVDTNTKRGKRRRTKKPGKYKLRIIHPNYLRVRESTLVLMNSAAIDLFRSTPGIPRWDQVETRRGSHRPVKVAEDSSGRPFTLPVRDD
ncbi:hypothetical protein H6P81_015729 [Aristolochia fimbriata]|uniref:Uncharacterized protein n=1 Tax=Aristolochia fimbriata TaxID=158543 RepID=A0AAV7E709_ARIFI|nr:hypothetical protein H6P81_015729 [Aristolochia fimbriata]